MSLLSDLINLNLSETTDKIIAEYICQRVLQLTSDGRNSDLFMEGHIFLVRK
ncbi:hypothetical protein JCGZ_12814 [Jatropha curcas]|uniref:Uncharacterized protein n=1 Tax=Jatropha curcas TaxID=180498 RepID=A0A067KPT2_JATCU|nr:hypothetical protein JCGZ_12814 [Jatropha curcas]